MVSDEDFELANRRGAARLNGPTVLSAHYDRRIGRVVLSLSTGYDIAFPPRAAEGIEHAKSSELDTIESARRD
jgi:hypothetical protein